MNSFSNPIAKILLVILVTIASIATASTDRNTEADRITKAMELYTQAVQMELGSTQKTELLNRSESILLDVIEQNPASLDAHRKLMGVYLQMRDYSKAIRIMQNAITLSPEDPKLFIALAILYDHQAAYEYALPVLDQALALDPNLQMARDYKATIQQKVEMQKMAMESNAPPHETGQHSSE